MSQHSHPSKPCQGPRGCQQGASTPTTATPNSLRLWAMLSHYSSTHAWRSQKHKLPISRQRPCPCQPALNSEVGPCGKGPCRVTQPCTHGLQQLSSWQQQPTFNALCTLKAAAAIAVPGINRHSRTTVCHQCQPCTCKRGTTQHVASAAAPKRMQQGAANIASHTTADGPQPQGMPCGGMTLPTVQHSSSTTLPSAAADPLAHWTVAAAQIAQHRLPSSRTAAAQPT
jgi:hypothetical protein